MTMDQRYVEAKQRRESLEAELSAATATYPAGTGAGNGGLTPDKVKQSPEWQAAHTAVKRAMKALQDWNAYMVRTFKRQMQAERRNRFAKR